MCLSLYLSYCTMRMCSCVCFLYKGVCPCRKDLRWLGCAQHLVHNPPNRWPCNGRTELFITFEKGRLSHCAKILLSLEWTEEHLEKSLRVPEKYPRYTLGIARKHVCFKAHWQCSLAEKLPWLTSSVGKLCILHSELVLLGKPRRSVKAASQLSWFWRLVLIQKGSTDRSESLPLSDPKSVGLRQGNLGGQQEGGQTITLEGCSLQMRAAQGCIPSTQHTLCTQKGSVNNPREMLALERIVLNAYVVTIFTEDQGNPLYLGNVTRSRSSVLKPLKTYSLSGALVWVMKMQGGALIGWEGWPCRACILCTPTPRLQVIGEGWVWVVNMGLERAAVLRTQPRFPDLCVSG